MDQQQAQQHGNTQLDTAADLARKARRYRELAAAIRAGTTIYGRTERRCQRDARNLEQIVRNMADANISRAEAA